MNQSLWVNSLPYLCVYGFSQYSTAWQTQISRFCCDMGFAGLLLSPSVSWGLVGPGFALGSFLLQIDDPGCLKVKDGSVAQVSLLCFVQC